MPSNTSAVNTATRILAGDDKTRYDAIAVSLHWLTVALVLTQFVLAETWSWFARPTHHAMVLLHMSFGIILGAVVIARIVWRLIPGHQLPPAVAGWQQMASKAVHWLLYLMLLAEFVLGFVLRWTGKEAMSFFGLPIPPMIPPVSRPTNELIGAVHHWNGWAIIILAAGHAAAALHHHFIVKDRVLTRMAPWLKRRTA